MADVKACLMAFVYLSGAWSWIARQTADREGLPYEPCVLDRGHAARHEAGVRVVAAQYNHLNYLRSTAEPDRDRRREAYRALQREAARKALDAWFRAVDADGSRWKEWEAFIESTAAYAACELQQKSHYGATERCVTPGHVHVHADSISTENDCTIIPRTVAHNADYAAWARDEIAKHHSADHGARPGPECTCVQASDTGHDPDCPRAAFARGAAPHNADHGVPSGPITPGGWVPGYRDRPGENAESNCARAHGADSGRP